MARKTGNRNPTPPVIAFAIVSTGTLLATIDSFVVNVALPSIGRSLDSSVSSLSWVLNGYSITFAALLVPAGRIADRNGRKAGFLIGVSVFTVASAACAASPTASLLVISRLVQAVGAAFLIPASLGLLLAAFPTERRGVAIAGMTAVTAASAALGPVVGGLLAAIDWRLIFLVNVPIGAAAALAGARWLPAAARQVTPAPDLLGAGTLATSTATLSIALVNGNTWGWASPRIVSALATSTVLAAWFVRRCAKHPAPVIELSLLRVRNFAAASLATTLYSAAFSGMLLSVLLWAQTAWHWSALHAGLAFIPGPGVVLLLSPRSARVAERLGAGSTAAFGCGVFASAALFSYVAVSLTPNYLGGMLPVVLLMGFGVLFALPTLVTAATASLPPQRLATGSAAISMARQLGFTLGVALFLATADISTQGHAEVTEFEHGWLTITLIAATAATISLALRQQPTEACERPEQPEAAVDLAA
jgi:EmrB/QacA subfamily drug resistance transporter